jgi:hypothetical protein
VLKVDGDSIDDRGALYIDPGGSLNRAKNSQTCVLSPPRSSSDHGSK